MSTTLSHYYLLTTLYIIPSVSIAVTTEALSTAAIHSCAHAALSRLALGPDGHLICQSDHCRLIQNVEKGGAVMSGSQRMGSVFFETQELSLG